MSRLNQEPDVVGLARALGLDSVQPPVEQIVKHCRQRIDGWFEEHGKIETLAHLEEVVCQRLSLLIEQVFSDSELDDLIKRYALQGEPVFCTLKNDLDDQTFAALLARRDSLSETNPRYVAVIDCRGDKRSRRFFSRWHEIAHLLTLTKQIEIPFHRSTVDRDPLERLMDVIAGKVGFYEPILLPALSDSLKKTGRLSFAGVESVRRAICPDASFHATLIACASLAPVPVVQVTAGLGLKTNEAKIAEAGQAFMFPDMEPVPKLRVLKTTPNESARKARLRIHRNMEIPRVSTIWSLFHNDGNATEVIAAENLADWVHSSGKPLGDMDVCIEAGRFGEEIIALVQPI